MDLAIGSLPPIRGQAYTHYFIYSNVDEGGFAARDMDASRVISKDGGAFGTTTNGVTSIGLGFYTIVLTATEMDADIVCLNFRDTTDSPLCAREIIYTVVGELSTAPASTTSFAQKITAVFQYLFNKRTITSTQEKLYKVDGSTVLATGTLADDGTTFTKGAPV